MTHLTLAAHILAAAAGSPGWDVPGVYLATEQRLRYGRKPSGAARAKREAKCRRNISKRLPK